MEPSMKTELPKLKLTYFDFDGGRGEAARLAMVIGDIPFEDHRFPVAEWPVMKEQTPLHQVPVLEVNGEVITQSNTINRLVGKLAGLYPEDALDAAHCDEAMATIEDIITKIVTTFDIQDEEEKRLAREALAAGPITLYLRRLDAMLESRGSRYFAAGRLTVADLKVFLWTRNLVSGLLDHVPTDIVGRTAPLLLEHLERISAQAQIAAYYQR